MQNIKFQLQITKRPFNFNLKFIGYYENHPLAMRDELQKFYNRIMRNASRIKHFSSPITLLIYYILDNHNDMIIKMYYDFILKFRPQLTFTFKRIIYSTNLINPKIKQFGY